MNPSMKIILPGGAGLVGQNLLVRLKAQGFTNLVVLDKHEANLAILRQLHPDVVAEQVDLAEPGAWQNHCEGAEVVVMLQAQIGGLVDATFQRNNLQATQHVLEAIKTHQVPHLIHISSSVVASVAEDGYTRTKKQQEAMVLGSGVPCVVLRPTLMFGWFDRKHLGWLSRFMKKTPIFPIPGHGRYMRQPLYVGDFANIIVSCIVGRICGGVYNISGHEKIDYIDMIRTIKAVTQSRTCIMKLPYPVFDGLLRLWACCDKNPPFTTQQLAALVAKDEFEVMDWPGLFGVSCTPFQQAVHETFHDPQYSQTVLEF